MSEPATQDAQATGPSLLDQCADDYARAQQQRAANEAEARTQLALARARASEAAAAR
ncbi:hypothetical protein [Streptomyces stelliscabiei]|uniref:hypothetical protein n=1 Tax=Streptomyces stelliscabiei TaxID=146820 RepID=UPI0029A79B09|nr:hypothetical protein [Streptomyces stelliscabiei]MDX2519376.1 hypothetical protein [Streptomyces stelliscabiei]MDX2549694.1 hypothetical protein [Streptomyces stelliscabiei]MDX2616124.1 hypothetical protein [Streptomyces stelliscabiei]MDX2634188.1 hypothetical protein [Streptomyces stelliscabiei]MDX2664601.1 hypothetical protein [Streptomyces stelliscabiei]